MTAGEPSEQPSDHDPQRLATPVERLAGVGSPRAPMLARLGLRTVADVLFHFPRDYQDLSDLRSIADLEEGKLISVRGVIEDVELRSTGTGKSILGVLIGDGADHLRAVWFNQPFLRETFRPGQHALVIGKAQRRGGRWQMSHPRYEVSAGPIESPGGKLLPVYRLTEGINQHQMRRIVRGALDGFADSLEEVFDEHWLIGGDRPSEDPGSSSADDERFPRNDLWPIVLAVRQIHFPDSPDHLSQARHRFIYQELLILQLALALRRLADTRSPAPVVDVTAKIDARIRRLTPFELTPGQRQAIDDIRGDLARPRPMNRLLHGEVGSGKTFVAVYAMLSVVACGFQAALMAPTELLARQHYDTLRRLLEASKVRIGLFVGGQPAAERRELVERLRTGEIDLAVGTHALISPEVQFDNLAFVVIDEQHKFGVSQRRALRYDERPASDDSANHPGSPHYLVMSATPIPRTLALAVFGDMDVSTIRDRPVGRQEILTYLVDESQRGQWWEFFRRKLREGRQGYIVAPRVDDDRDTTGVEQLYESLTNGELEAFRVGLLHGRMSADERQTAMEAFRTGTTQALVATSLVEVGVDVPNATLMTVEDAGRFGLAQLHQLRGRISRGERSGYVGLFAPDATDDARRRLAVLVDTTDGFEIAEQDFRTRGSGDLLGSRQHGLPPMRIADFARDGEVLGQARDDARRLVAADPELQRPEHVRLKRMTLRRYGAVLDLGDVG